MTARGRERDAGIAAAFDRALDLDGAGREAFVASLGDLREDVEALLRSHAAMGAGFLAEPAAARAAAECALPGPGDLVGRYRLEAVAGRGASGVVFAARQDHPNRLVALKLLREPLASDEGIARFRLEAEVLARLSHADIAHVYDAGLHDGRPFIVMELVRDARTITQYADAKRLPETARIALAERACAALHHAHSRGVVHRDVKPANLVVDHEGRLRVLDFGIAALGASDARGTAGTPAWMSPEQAAGGTADARSDVYGLGAVLHELLTARTPVDVAGLGIDEALRRVATAEPAPTGLPPDLDAVLRRALARDPAGRYATAAEFAEDLRRYVGRFPVRARPASAARAGVLFVRRRPGLAASLAVAGVALVAGTAVSVGFAIQADGARLAAEDVRDGAIRQAYVAEIVAAGAAIELHDMGTARLALARAPERHRGFEWRHLAARLDDGIALHDDPGFRPFSAAPLHGGTHLAVAGTAASSGMEVRVFDLAAGTWESRALPGPEPVAAIGIAPDGVTPIVGRRDGSLVRLPAGEDAVVVPGAHDGAVNAIDPSPAGLVATAGLDGRVRLWSADLAAAVRTIAAHRDRAVCARFSPSGDLLATTGRDEMARIWDPATGALVRELAGHQGSVDGAAWSPDGSRLATTGRDGALRIWNVREGGAPVLRNGHRDVVRDVAWSPDGSRIATASYDRTVGLWDASDGRLLRRFAGHEFPVRTVAFAAGGGRMARIVSATFDGVREWSEGAPSAVLRHLDSVDRRSITLALSGDGGTAWVGCLGGEVASVGVLDGTQHWLARMTGGMVRAIGDGGDGTVVVVTNDGTVTRLRATDGQVAGAVRSGIAAEAAAVVPAPPDGTRSGPVVVVAARGVLHTLDPVRGTILARETRPDAGSPMVSAVASDPVTGRLVVGDVGGGVRVGTPTSGVREFTGAGDAITAVGISPSGEAAVWGTAGGTLELRDAGTGARRWHTHAFAARVRCVRFTADGTRVVAGGDDRSLRILDAVSGAEMLVVRPGWVVADVRFTPGDGALVAVSLEDVETGALIVLRASR